MAAHRQKGANRQTGSNAKATAGPHTLMAASHMLSEESRLTNSKEMEPNMAVANYLCHALSTLRCRRKYGAKPIWLCPVPSKLEYY